MISKVKIGQQRLRSGWTMFKTDKIGGQKVVKSGKIVSKGAKMDHKRSKSFTNKPSKKNYNGSWID